MANDVNKMNAAVKFYLDTVKFGNNSYNENTDFIYPPIHDNINRKGKNWNVFDVDISSKLNKIRHNDLVTLKIENPWFKESISNTIDFDKDYMKHDDYTYYSETTIDLADLYYFIFKEFDFKFRLFKNNSEIMDFSVEKTEETTYYGSHKYFSYRFKKSGSILNSSELTKIKVYLNNEFKEKDISFFEKSSYNLKSLEMMNSNKIIPIMFFDKNDVILDNVEMTYRINGNYGILDLSNNASTLSVKLLDKSKKIYYSAKYIEFVLGVKAVISRNDIKSKTGIVYDGDLSKLNKYLYWKDEEITSAKYFVNGDSIELYSVISLNDLGTFNGYKDFVIKSDDVREFTSNSIEIDNHNNFVSFDRRKVVNKEIIINVNNVSTSGNENYKLLNRSDLKYKEIVNGKEIDKKIQISNPTLVKVYDKNGNEYEFKKDTTNWTINSILVYFKEKIENKDLIFKFISTEMILDKNELGITPEKTEHPFISLYEDRTEIFDKFFYSHDQETGETISFFFKFDLNDDEHKNKEYEFQIIDYQKIYDFKVTETNYFDKDLNFMITSYMNYDGEMPISNFIVNVSESGEIIGSVVNQAYYTSYDTNYKDLNYELTALSTKYLTVPENRTYDVNVNTLYVHNDFYEFVNLSNRKEYVDFATSSTIKYGYQFPYVNFYGYFVDSLGHRLNEISQLHQNATTSYFKDGIALDGIMDANTCNYDKLENGKNQIKFEIKNNKFDYIASSNLVGEVYRFNSPSNQQLKGYDFYFRETLKKYSSDQRIYSIYPGTYNASLYMNNELLKDFGQYEITKENEKNGDFYGIKLEWPKVNVIGKVINKSNDEIIHKVGMKVRFKNKITSKTSDFIYKNGYNYENDNMYEGYVCSYNNYSGGFSSLYGWSDRFQYLFQGFKKTPRININGSYYSTSSFHNFNSINSNSALDEGIYEVSLLDENDNLISVFSNDFEVSKKKQSELYDVEFEFPLCKFTGFIKDQDGNIIYEDGLKILLENENDSTKSEEFIYRIYNKSNGHYRTSFEFNSLGKNFNENEISSFKNTSVNIYKENDSTPYKIGSAYYSKGLTPGDYRIKVFYKGKEINILSQNEITISKEKESNGELNDFEIRINSIYTNLSGYVVNDQYNNVINCSIIKMNILDENYDGDLSNDFTDTTNEKTSSISSGFEFANVTNLGYYKIDLFQSNYVNNIIVTPSIKIELNDVTDLSGNSVFKPSGDSDGCPYADIFNITKLSYENSQMNGIVHTKYWRYPMFRSFRYVDEHYGERRYLTYKTLRDYSIFRYDSVKENYVDGFAIKETRPYLNTKLTVRNNSLNEETTENSYSYGHEIYDTSYSFSEYNFYKSGNYTLTLKSKDYLIDLCTKTFELSGIVKGEKYYNYEIYNDSLNCVSLNMNVVVWNEEIEKYETLKGYYSYNDNYNNNMMKTEFKFKFNDSSTLTSYYENDEYYHLEYSYAFPTLDGQRKLILPGLLNTGKYKYELRYGGSNDDRHIVKFKGLYKADISKSYTNDPNVLNGFSLKSIIKTYVIPTDNGLNGIDESIESVVGEETYNKVFKFGDTNDFSSIANILTTPLDSLLNDSTYPNKTISSYLSSSIEDLLVNHLDENGLIEISGLNLTNPNPSPIKYNTLVVEEMCMNILADIRFNDNGILKLHDFAMFGNILKLEIYDKNENLEKTIFNKASMFNIPFLKSGYHKFKISMYGNEIYEKDWYIYSPENIDIVIDQSNFTDLPVSGSLTFGSKNPIDITHITVYNNDLSSFYYSGNCNGVGNNNLYGNSYHPEYYDASYAKYPMNTYDDSYSVNYSSNYYNTLAGNIMKEYPTDLSKYTDKTMKYTQYRLYDLLPGNYTIKYFIVPMNISTISRYHMEGDSSFIKSITSNLSSIVSGTEKIYVKKSEIGYGNVYNYDDDDETSHIRNQIDYAKMTLMRAKLIYSLNAFGGSEITTKQFYFENVDEAQKYHYNGFNDSWNDTYNSTGRGQNWIDLNFKCTLCQKDNEEAFEIEILKTNIPQNETDVIKDISYIKLNLLFAEQMAEQTVNIEKTTTSIPSMNLTKQYCQKFTLNIENSNSAYEKYFKLISSYNSYTKLYDANGTEITNSDMNSNIGLDSTSNVKTFIYYGLEVGTYTVKIFERNTNRVMFEFNNLVVDDTFVTRDVTMTTYSMSLTFKDKALNNKQCSSPMSVRMYNSNNDLVSFAKGGYTYNVISFENGKYDVTCLGNDTYNILVHESNGYRSYGSYYYNDERGDNVFYDFTGSKCVAPLSSIAINGSNVSKDIIVPYQFFNISMNSYDLKIDSNSSSIPNGVYMTLIRKNGDSFDETINNLNASRFIKSGLYSIEYRSINYNGEQDANGSIITYEDQYIDSSKTFTLYVYITLISNMTITLKERYNGAANITSNCKNKVIRIYDDNENIYRSMTTNSEGKATIDSIPNLKFKFGIDGYKLTSIYQKLTDNNKNITLIMEDDKTLTFGN